MDLPIDLHGLEGERMMFVYALDARHRSNRLVMAGDISAPDIWETRIFPRTLGHQCVLDQLRIWKANYAASSGAVVCCQQDPISSELLNALKVDGYTVELVDGRALQEVEKLWRRLGPDPRWLRAGWMASLLSVQHQHGVSKGNPREAALTCLYALLRGQLIDLETMLWAEGLLRCPGHLSPHCPNCQESLWWSDEQEIPF